MSIQRKVSGNKFQFLKCGYFFLIIVVVIFLLYCIKLLFLPLCVSILLALFVLPAINFFETRGLRRIHIIIGLYIVMTGVAAFGVIYLLPKVMYETHVLAQNMPHYQSMIDKVIGDIQGVMQKKFPDLSLPDFKEVLRTRLPSNKGITVDALIQYLSSFFTLMSVVIIIPFITFFLLAEGHLIKKFFLAIIPNSYFELTVLLTHKIGCALKDFLRGQMIDASAVGIMTAIGLAILGLPYFLAIGIIAGFGNLIPYLGPFIGFVPALLAVIMSPEGLNTMSLVSLIVVFLIVQIIEGTIVYPFAVGRTVNLHPLVIILGVTIGGQVGGIIGMLAAIPIISVVKVTLTVIHSYLKSYSVI